MALTDPPEVQFIGAASPNDGWIATTWDTEFVPVESVQRGKPLVPAGGVEILHWTVQYGDEHTKVCVLRVASSTAPAPQKVGAREIAAGTYPTMVRRSSATEVIIRDADTVTIG